MIINISELLVAIGSLEDLTRRLEMGNMSWEAYHVDANELLDEINYRINRPRKETNFHIN